MVYHEHQISIPSLEGLSKLAVGHPMRLTPSHMSATKGMGIHLTSTQMDKIKHRCSEGKGMDLKLSKAQLEHHMKGSGWFGNLLKTVHGHAKKALNFLGKHQLTQELLGKVKERASHHIKSIGNELIDQYLPAGNSGKQDEAYAAPYPRQEVANIQPSLERKAPKKAAPHRIPVQVHEIHNPTNSHGVSTDILAAALKKRRGYIAPEGEGLKRRGRKKLGGALG